MRQVIGEVEIATQAPGLIGIDGDLEAWLLKQSIRDGLLTAMIRHTSASLTIQENADPAVLEDLQSAMAGFAPHGGRERYRHSSEGPDDMASHIRTVLSGVNLAIPVSGGRMMLGTWQGVYLWEHRDRGRLRRIALHLLGE